jgi:hypothetical protein
MLLGESRRMIFVVCMVEIKNVYKILVGKPEGKRPLRSIGADGRLILKWILRK